MKHLLPLLLAFTLSLLLLCGCGPVRVRDGASVNLYCINEDGTVYDMHLSEEEAAEIVSILDGKWAMADTPSCGFGEDLAFHVGGAVFAVARDGCGILQKKDDGRYLMLSDTETEYFHSLLEKYGISLPMT